jgi:hypothetical protein
MPNGEDKWTWSDERAFIENLLNTRFGSLLILFELVVLGAVMCDEQSHLQIVLWLGVLILAPVSVSIFGAQWKFDWILKKLRKESPESPIVQLSAAGKHIPVRWAIGYVVPLLCVGTVLAGAILATFDVLHVRAEPSNIVTAPAPSTR